MPGAPTHPLAPGGQRPPDSFRQRLLTGVTWSDYLLAGFALLFIGPVWGAFGLSPGLLAGAVSVLATLVMPAALLWRRVRPVHSAIAVYLAALAHFIAGTPLLPTDVLVFVSLYSVTAYGPRWAQRAGLAGAILGAALQAGYFAVTGSGDLVIGLIVGVLISALVVSAWALGLMRKAMMERRESLADRAARLEVERDQQAQIATAAERARIAREMHDIVAHSLSVVISQADGGRYAATADPQAAQRALETIADSGRSALADLRRILGVLREDEPGDERAPQPAERNLDDLIEGVREAGLPVSVVRMGRAGTLPAAAGLALYRIVQESLTNAMKYAGPGAEATVVLHWSPEQVTVSVEDNGRGAAAESATEPGGGHGLVGMRERASMLGGRVSAGPREGGGWRVRAVLPLTPARNHG